MSKNNLFKDSPDVVREYKEYVDYENRCKHCGFTYNGSQLDHNESCSVLQMNRKNMSKSIPLFTQEESKDMVSELQDEVVKLRNELADLKKKKVELKERHQ